MTKRRKDLSELGKWLPPDKLEAFQKNLLAWYQIHQRDLPWRRPENMTPYRILVSEIMLHQTQVQTVIPVYEKFLERFPTIGTLAKAPLEEIKAITDGLGYKVRGSWLKEIAEIIIEKYQGKIPQTLDALQKLPGIGRYTAGAILSFAFQHDAPIVDVNVERVLSRIFGVDKSGFQSPAKYQHLLWDLAHYVIPSQKGPIFNQALMDFGALICTARTPCCSVSPMRGICIYYRTHPQQLSIDQFFSKGPKNELLREGSA
ncbi:MAG: A/G-specific adenine glycosylase [Candidatus Heimdallarchaeota archaeon]